MRIAYVSPEVVPFAKTGGLADVAGALPKALSELGHKVSVFMPLYGSIDKQRYDIKCLMNNLRFLEPDAHRDFDLYHCRLPGCDVNFYFVKYDPYFERDGLYLSPATGKDWPDNDLRFAGMAKMVLESLLALQFEPEVIHVNDWQCALIPAYLRVGAYKQTPLACAVTIFTVHNIAYQGLFPAESFSRLGFDAGLFSPLSPFEYYGQVNFLKIGISLADLVTTVSEKYAMEIQSSSEYGYGLEGVLKSRAEDLYGVINGIDYSIWDPATDKLIAANYSIDKMQGKAKNKVALRRLMKLPLVRRDVPLIGMISRLANQKGFDLIAAVADDLFQLDIQIVILGTGDKEYEELLQALAKKYPKKLAVALRFDDALAHQIEAGADMFLMPSRYEPCGLNQLYSLRYGTIPIVRATGGLDDTIEELNIAADTGTGFKFRKYDGKAMLETIRYACEVYRNKEVWLRLVKRGMQKDFSWRNSALKYLALYSKAVEKRAGTS